MEEGLIRVNVEDVQDFMSMTTVVRDVAKSSWDCRDLDRINWLVVLLASSRLVRGLDATAMHAIVMAAIVVAAIVQGWTVERLTVAVAIVERSWWSWRWWCVQCKIFGAELSNGGRLMIGIACDKWIPKDKCSTSNSRLDDLFCCAREFRLPTQYFIGRRSVWCWREPQLDLSSQLHDVHQLAPRRWDGYWDWHCRRYWWATRTPLKTRLPFSWQYHTSIHPSKRR